MNTTLTASPLSAIDAQCHEWSRHAFYCAEHLVAGVSDNTAYGMRIRIPALADRIIAARSREAAQGIAARTAQQQAQGGAL